MAIIIPPYRGPNFLIDSNISDEAGFVPKEEIIPFEPEILCIMNRGEEATLILSDWMYGGNVDLTFNGKISKFMKMGFDAFYFYSHGKMPPEWFKDYLNRLLIKCLNK